MAQQPSGKGVNIPKIIIPENVSEFYINSLFVASTDWDFMLIFGSMTLPSSISISSVVSS
jgi:hypothetical protein